MLVLVLRIIYFGSRQLFNCIKPILIVFEMLTV